jgi:hypothetical protein
VLRKQVKFWGGWISAECEGQSWAGWQEDWVLDSGSDSGCL